MSLLVVGMSHRTAPVEVLERAALTGDAVAKLLDEVHTADHLTEAVVLATCNRVEVYADAATFHGGVEEAGELIALHAGTDLHAMTPHLYVHYEDRAVAHLFGVTSGLDSMVVGESQILGQVRDALRIAQTSGAAGRVLNELFQTALRVGKRAHTETGVDRAGRSLVTVGLETVGRHVGGIAGRRAVVVGAGSMAALATATLRRLGVEDIAVVNRTPERAARLAEAVGGRAVPADDLPHELAETDLVVSCTGAAGVVIPYDLVEMAVRARAARPLALVDLALPHDVDPGVRELPGVAHVDLASLAGDPHVDDVADDVEAVRGIVGEELSLFVGSRLQARVAPTVVALRSMADALVAAELTRLRARVPGLDGRVDAEVAATVRRVVDKLLHSPTVRVKELAAEPGGAEYERALRELFALDLRTVEAVARPDEGEVGR
ncbi:MAG TPA: glutamyl-tRNA reductase [Jiangellales bacterium]|nr:glutamyl-tRNA reductase [Jiangellales bacterium]